MQPAAPLAAAIRQSILTMTATVWARTSNSGPYNNAVKTGLACRLDTVNVQPARTGSERADLAALRSFAWDAEYAFPETGVQIEVTSPSHYAGQRWNPQTATKRPAIPPGFDAPIYIEMDVRRAS